jgi:hypothetical protein
MKDNEVQKKDGGKGRRPRVKCRIVPTALSLDRITAGIEQVCCSVVIRDLIPGSLWKYTFACRLVQCVGRYDLSPQLSLSSLSGLVDWCP